MAALVRENKERKELLKQAKLKAIAEEQAAKMKKLEKEMEEKKKAAEVEAAAEAEEERKRREVKGESSGTANEEAAMEKKISEWIANLSLGEDEEAEMYVPQDERDALARELATIEDPLERQETEEEKKLEWKLRMKREKKRRREEVNRLIAEVVKEQLEDQVFVVYIRPVTEPKQEFSYTDSTIAKMLEEFKDLSESPTGVVPRPIQHMIEIDSDSRTPKGAIYSMSPRELEELRKQLDELLEKGWIRPSSSPFGAPVLFVPKKEGELRMCIDYRGLNAITVKNVEPLPRIDDLLDRVQGCKYFSKIDLNSGYHQIEVHPDDQYKTVFRTRYGHYEFIVMPFGLTNAPATFQRCMNDLFRPWLDRFVVVYLNDILVFRRTLQEHQGHLRQVLEKLREANFKINAKKCEWAKTQVLYLGHVLDGDGIKSEDSKIAAIRDWLTPRTLTELRSFLGLANYYRKFVRNFSTIAAPLRRLLKKEAIWQWDKDCTSALKKLKRALIEYPVLKVADPSCHLSPPRTRVNMLVGTDHAVFNSTQKRKGQHDFKLIPNGVNGIEERMHIVWDIMVNSGKITPSDYVRITSTACAQIFNIYPRKGAIAVGSDADIIILNPEGRTTISAAKHHSKMDTNVYEGWDMKGKVEVTIRRGEVVWENDELKNSGKITPSDYVRITSTACAQIFNIYPRKGAIAVGSDADIIILNPEGRTTISAAKHHSKMDTNVYEGWDMKFLFFSLL
ncbi:hypothetical protein CBR_g36942 [Chara braunii]|uniref:Reverse transcriptase domain-containing protein n=1 Tax=Chara braunii TaxID=69332 RepID=A0A388JZP7_CHABU|nr:hypothetical protein CBR_g36942 [Chara braunii]|eukprot:GBG63173.1 hypothetical protein CBR_g36942 [Chara braunii]